MKTTFLSGMVKKKNASEVKRIKALREEIEAHSYQYYVLDAPGVPDSHFDKLLQDLQALEEERPDLITEDSPTQRVGGAPLDRFETVGCKTSSILNSLQIYNETQILNTILSRCLRL